MKEQIEKLGKGTLVYGVGQVLTKLIHFLMLPVFTAYLTPADYGVISILTVFSFLAAPIFGLGLSNSIGIVYFERDADSQKRGTIWTSFVILLASSAFFLVISFWFSDVISQLAFQTTAYGDLVKIVAVSTVFNGIINQPFIFRLQFEQRSKRFVLITLIATTITVSTIVIYVVILQQGVEGFIRATLIGNSITFFVYFFAVVRWTKFSFDKITAYELLRLGYPMIPAVIFIFLIQNSGRYMLQLYFGSGEVGIYSVGYTFGMAINVAVTAFSTAWFPYFNSFVNRKDEARQIFGKTLLYYVFSLGSLCLLLFIFARPLVTIMTEASFYEAHSVVGLIALGNFLVGAYSILSAAVYFAKKIYLLNIILLGAAASCLLFNFLLIPSMGMLGAAIAFLIANFCMAMFQYIMNRRMNLLAVDYDWRRIGYFALTVFLVVGLSFIPRNVSLAQELLISMVQSVGVFLLLYAQLLSGEKTAITELWRSVLAKSIRQ